MGSSVPRRASLIREADQGLRVEGGALRRLEVPEERADHEERRLLRRGVLRAARSCCGERQQSWIV